MSVVSKAYTEGYTREIGKIMVEYLESRKRIWWKKKDIINILGLSTNPRSFYLSRALRFMELNGLIERDKKLFRLTEKGVNTFKEV